MTNETRELSTIIQQAWKEKAGPQGPPDIAWADIAAEAIVYLNTGERRYLLRKCVAPNLSVLEMVCRAR